jgi:hypothetical protein
MILDRSVIRPGLFLLLMLWCFLSPLAASGGGNQASRKRSDTVWVVFFSSRDCPRCESVKALLDALKSSCPSLRTRVFDVARQRDYALFRRLETIHSDGEFAVPLIMVGESILEGEDQISAKLEKAVKRLSRSGGAPLPYLGRNPGKKLAVPERQPEKCPCQNKGGPPSIREEMGKIKVIFDKFF